MKMTHGSKYQATRDLKTKEIAKLIRTDIRAAVKSGELPAGDYSVRLRRSSLSSAIDVRATFDFHVRRDSRVHDDARRLGHRMPWFTARAFAAHEKLEAIHAAYNYDNSDTQSDYFDVRYYGSVSVHGADETDSTFESLLADPRTDPRLNPRAPVAAVPASKPTLHLVAHVAGQVEMLAAIGAL